MIDALFCKAISPRVGSRSLSSSLPPEPSVLDTGYGVTSISELNLISGVDSNHNSEQDIKYMGSREVNEVLGSEALYREL
jgi:hypothetical protein